MALSFCLAEGVRGRIDIASVSFGGYKEMWAKNLSILDLCIQGNPTDQRYLEKAAGSHTELAGFRVAVSLRASMLKPPRRKSFISHPLNEIISICISSKQKSIWRIYIWK